MGMVTMDSSRTTPLLSVKRVVPEMSRRVKVMADGWGLAFRLEYLVSAQMRVIGLFQ
jgi:hypothetical protein